MALLLNCFSHILRAYLMFANCTDAYDDDCCPRLDNHSNNQSTCPVAPVLRFNTSRFACSSIICLTDDVRVTTSVQFANIFPEYFALTYHTEYIRLLQTLLASLENMALVWITPASLYILVTSLNSTRSQSPA